MIEWRRIETDGPPEEGKYLVYQDNGNKVAIYRKDRSLGLTWWTEDNYLILDVTHYLPLKETE